MTPATIGELLHWSYANLAMAHSAVAKKGAAYGRINFMIRAKLLKGLRTGTMNVGSLVEDERLKFVLPLACCYCGTAGSLSVDHLLPSSQGGPDTGDNVVWACRSCNSSKGKRDLLVWYSTRQQFPPLYLLRRYLKLAIGHCEERGLLELPLGQALELPFVLEAIPKKYPPPSELVMWCTELPVADAGGGCGGR